MIHRLKILPEYFEAVKQKVKRAEFRKNDRDFKVGDLLLLEEYDKTNNQYTGRFILVRITHVTDLADWAAGYVMLSIDNLSSGKALRVTKSNER
ncbi:DUF3850 domain-containing protein [Snodgrassella alvi]|uniref:ASCH domain-containing protein n=1 Tax=Snodgrassella alvi TaxID=1196083 RepID=A0A2N9Y0R8_9NEIS|nr:DUF3850 domain-containing protein [Snodgrassella alvi]PIT58365.1 hypothetical protein BHC49_01800 [Snodgrassella alvi]